MKLIPITMLMLAPVAVAAQQDTLPLIVDVPPTREFYVKGYMAGIIYSDRTPSDVRDVSVSLRPFMPAIGGIRNNTFMWELGINNIWANRRDVDPPGLPESHTRSSGFSVFANASWRLPIMRRSRLGFWLGPELHLGHSMDRYRYMQGSTSSGRTNTADVGLAIVPRINYRFTDRLIMDVSFVNLFAVAQSQVTVRRTSDPDLERRSWNTSAEIDWNETSMFRVGLSYRLAVR